MVVQLKKKSNLYIYICVLQKNTFLKNAGIGVGILEVVGVVKPQRQQAKPVYTNINALNAKVKNKDVFTHIFVLHLNQNVN